MAIFGNLADMALPDVLTMVGRGTGRFMLTNTSSRHDYELHLDKGMLNALLVDSDPVQDIFQLRNRMTELLNLSGGEFEFDKLPAAFLLSHYALSIDMLLLSALSALDEVAAYRPHLPDSQTVFLIQPSKEAWLEGDLLEFWECSNHLLAQGASAEKIAEQTSLFTDHVLLCLYKLRTTGLIAPVRAFQSKIENGLKPALPSAVTPSRPPDDNPVPEREISVVHDELQVDPPTHDETGIIQRIMVRLRRGFTSHA